MIDRAELLSVIAEGRGDAVVITTMSAIQDWVDMASPDGLDFNVAGAMGYASTFGLGIALGCTDRRVIVIDGDGSLLMNLGALVTVGHVDPPNLIHLVVENGMYELTGGDPTPGWYDLAGFAKAAGINKVYRFDELAAFRDNWKELMGEQGPIFVSVAVAQGPGQPLRRFPPDQIRKLEAALQRPVKS